MLPDGVHHVVFRGQVDRLRVLDHVFEVLGCNFPVRGNHRMHAAIGEPANMPAGHAEIDAADFHIRHLLGFDDGVADVFRRGRRVGNFAFAHPTRARLPQADDIQGAGCIHFPDDRADFGRADFQTDNDRGRRIKHFSSCEVGLGLV